MLGPDESRTDGQIIKEAGEAIASGAKKLPAKVASGSKKVLLWAIKNLSEAALTSPKEASGSLKRKFVEKTKMGQDWAIYPIGIEDFNKKHKGLGFDWEKYTRTLGNEKKVALLIPRYMLSGKKIRQFEEFIREKNIGNIDDAKYQNNNLYKMHKFLDGIGGLEVVANSGNYKKDIVIKISTDCTYEEFEKRVETVLGHFGVKSPESAKEAAKRLWEGKMVEFHEKPVAEQNATQEEVRDPEASIVPQPEDALDTEIVSTGGSEAASIRSNEMITQADELNRSTSSQGTQADERSSRNTRSEASTQADGSSNGNTYNIMGGNTYNIYHINLQINFFDLLERMKNANQFEGPTIKRLASQSDDLPIGRRVIGVGGDGVDMVDSAQQIIGKEYKDAATSTDNKESDKETRDTSGPGDLENNDINKIDVLGDVSNDTFSSIGNLFENAIEDVQFNVDHVAEKTTINNRRTQQNPRIQQNPQELALLLIKSNIAHLVENAEQDRAKLDLPDNMNENLEKAKSVLDSLRAILVAKGLADAQLDKDDIQKVLKGNISISSLIDTFDAIRKSYNTAMAANPDNKSSLGDKARDAEDKIDVIGNNLKKIPALEDAIYSKSQHATKAEKPVIALGDSSSSILSQAQALGNSLAASGLQSCVQAERKGADNVSSKGIYQSDFNRPTGMVKQ